MIKCGVYSITNRVNGKVYIGSSVNLDRRWRTHLRDLSSGRHHSDYLQRAWNKYGAENFEFSVLEEVTSKDLLRKREQFYLDQYCSYNNTNGYNLRDIADPSNGFTHTEYSKLKMSLSHIGKKLTSETRYKMRLSKMGKPSNALGSTKSDDYKSKMSLMFSGCKNPFYGKKWSEEHKKKSSKRVKEYIRLNGNPMTGKSHSEEAKRKISIANRKKLSDEDIIEIRNFSLLGFTHKTIAAKFNVARQTISKILSGKLHKTIGVNNE